MKKNRNIYIVSLILIILDQTTKLLIKTSLSLNEELKIIPNFFSIHYLKNTGAAFSIFENQTIFLILISIACLITIIYYLNQEEVEKLYGIFLGMILGGIVGNLIDRIAYTGVIDFLSFKIFNYNFPVFNIADIGITLGVILLIIIYVFRSVKNKKML